MYRIGVYVLSFNLRDSKIWLRHHRLDALAMLALALFGLAVGRWASVVTLDDAMITFRVAENLAFGRGFVYNLGERVQVTTTPLYTMILAPGIWLLGSAPQAALILNLLLAALIPVLAYDLGRRLSGRITGLAGAVLLSLSPFLVMAFSMESYLYVALILAAVNAYAAGRWRLAGALVGLTALVRGDGALLAVVVVGYDALASRRLRWRLILPAAAIPALWYFFALGYFGTPFPATLGAKTAQGAFNWLGLRFWAGLLDYLRDWQDDYPHPAFYLLPLFLALGYVWALWKERPWLMLIGRDGLYVAAFVALNVPAAEWYYAPLMPGTALLIGRGIQVVADTLAGVLSRRTRPALAGSLAAGLVALLAWVTLPMTTEMVHDHPDWKAQAYPPTARWIAAHTSPAATLATIDIGHVGYWSNRRIIDIVGLAQPDVSPHIAQGDFGYAIRHYQPDLILLGYLWLDDIKQADWFESAYVARRMFTPPGIDQPLVLFSRREGVNLPPVTGAVNQPQPLAVDFNRQATLTGYQLDPQPARPGQNLSLTLFWQVNAPIEVDFTVFAQLVNSQNTILAQGDGKPQQGFYATPFWQPGETVVDLHPIALPANLPPGQYDILVGLYQANNGARLQILDEAGLFQSDAVRLSGIEVAGP